MTPLVLHALATLRALSRRRLTMAILVILPLSLYGAGSLSVGQSARALAFGISWSVSTVSFFATSAGRELDPRLRLAGRTRLFLTLSRTVALIAVGLVLAVGFWALVTLDLDVRSPLGLAADFAVTAMVAVAFGSAVGVVVSREMEGSLVLFLFAGLQAVADPFGTFAKFLPFWSSRELGTYAIDGPDQGSLGWALAHAAGVVALCLVVAAAAGALDRSPAGRRRAGDGGGA